MCLTSDHEVAGSIPGTSTILKCELCLEQTSDPIYIFNYLVFTYFVHSLFFQLDSVELDDEILNILKQQVVNVAKFMPVGFLSHWEPEINAILGIIIWKVSI